jgi:hypothetical protein
MEDIFISRVIDFSKMFMFSLENALVKRPWSFRVYVTHFPIMSDFSFGVLFRSINI